MRVVTKRLLEFLRHLLPVSLIALVTLSGSNADTSKLAGDAVTNMTASTIEFNNGKLSVSLDDSSLYQVMTEVSRQTGIDIQFIGEHPTSTVNIHFSDSLLEKGLRLLLREENTVFIYANKDKDGVYGRQLTKVFILPEGENSNVNNGIVTTIETLSGISQQIQDSIPQSFKDSNAHSSINNPLTDQALYELSGALSERILNEVQTSN